MSHDFFTSQTVKNAHVYYIRRCLHNWPDAHCIKILKQVVLAMASDSRILIAEMVVPEYVTSRRRRGHGPVLDGPQYVCNRWA
ncbi:hypothetical protein VTN77DRAFT_9750 [Rasamsonia byssochlamydoides]|uniref:uncharacterized protein n=1 Tax=Rasamsonia byssochlamydoides TaxID=89139 RepID=UPI003742CE3B